MKKLINCLIILLISYQAIFAQKKVLIDTVKPLQKFTSAPFGNNIKFYGATYDETTKSWRDGDFAAADTAIYQIYDWVKTSDKRYVDSLRKAHPKAYFVQSMPMGKILLGVKLDAGLTNYSSGDFLSGNKAYKSYTINNNTDAILLAMGINAANVKDYRYHVVQNDSVEIVPWSVPKLAQKYGAKKAFGFIGKFNVPGKELMIEIVNTKDYSDRAGMVFDWRTNFKPVAGDITIYQPGDNYFHLDNTAATHNFATKFDGSTHLPLNLEFRQGDILTIALTLAYHAPAPYTIWLKKTIKGKTETLQLETLGPNDEVYNFKSNNFNEPGKYELIIQPLNKWEEAQLARMPFEVLPPLPSVQRFTIKQIAPYAGITIAIFLLIFLIYYSYTQRRLINAAQQKAMANLKLSSVRSQLNPHFMFNALTSIQNLMNQQDTEGANHYLSTFAGLTRQVLNASGKELTSIEDELKLIDDHLLMEQLRFGFKYNINVDAGINKANAEVPTMLLQPFIENAAKHGVNTLRDTGNIEVSIIKVDRTLMLTVADNGPGFDANAIVESGFGLKLSRERIALLNQVYKDQPISLKIDSSGIGTKVTITLTDWI